MPFNAQIPTTVIPKEVLDAGLGLFALFVVVQSIGMMIVVIRAFRGTSKEQVGVTNRILDMQAQRDTQIDKLTKIIEKQDERILKMDVRSADSDRKITNSNETLTKAVNTLRGVIQISEGRLELADQRIQTLSVGQDEIKQDTDANTIRIDNIVEKHAQQYEEIRTTLNTINQRVGKIEDNLKNNHDLPPGTKALLQDVAARLEIVSKKTDTGEIKVPTDIKVTIENTPPQDADKPSEEKKIA